MVVFLILVMTLAVLHVETQQSSTQRKLDAQKRSIGSQYKFLLEGCVRLDILRAEDNRSHYADFKVFKTVYLESTSAVSQAAVPANQREAEKKFLATLKSALTEKSWTPLTDCTQAVNTQGVAYRPPQPIPFVKQLPTEKDLHYTPSLGK